MSPKLITAFFITSPRLASENKCKKFIDYFSSLFLPAFSISNLMIAIIADVEPNTSDARAAHNLLAELLKKVPTILFATQKSSEIKTRILYALSFLTKYAIVPNNPAKTDKRTSMPSPDNTFQTQMPT